MSNEIFSNKINILKALAIIIVVSGHLEFSFLGMFTPYSFQIALFFFISGYLFKDKYLNDTVTFIERRTKSLLVPYFLYSLFYLGVTILIAKLTGKFWGMPINLKNFFVTPFLNGHQLDLSCPLWFVTQLFMTLMVFLFLFKIFKKIYDNKYFHLILFSLIGLSAIPLTKIIPITAATLVIIRTMFSLLFVYLGYFYRNFMENKINIYSYKWAGTILILQSILWLFNRDFSPQQGIGLSYVLVWGRFDNQLIVPIITAITGIWASLFVVHIFYPYIKDSKFIKQIGENTYHIMANHLLVMYLLTALFLYLNGIPISAKNEHDIYWIFNPIQTTYFYFVVTIIISTYIGVIIKKTKICLQKFIKK